ncbi:hemolysin secretion protein d : RND family efflux transporter, MFP subunit OS=Singulisphaera acidiphila (strain ATCC BAA-1392 / DSM 18658 / VKM B-2454 / MOB10) GN=Sinac_6016 PE=4 SV=1: HlyD [Gemmataceae bacterium]|nr:hemolysin secretion protein d : RND family efflux transporter, MFP subunit OS=Singulisphaera acidiphila (strain ATCC BAA-1392 / DSM 18658 / VKM B-2454 / MOB10) GN=Sinac_6016 PE=4 SV=1: HlyD [Gemmataceae bacterium]VTT96917.1 hemolysin secretion protein d : RND family efflux transporter, MFP subunit OS=Singulisphaera acidiphila (strain ATCC BAA-1392 / DSM 18658 / VKM B-2454 / MOB10) GN=Sinac_6016 PE=4 SV=1: HlyD [Gemmataceae bacterium]
MTTFLRFVAMSVAVVATLAGCARKTPDPAPQKPQSVTVTTPIVRTISDYEDFTGRTEPFKVVELRSRVTGYLDKVHFADGTDVMSGEPLFGIDPRVYKAEYDRASAALLKAEKHYKTMALLHDRVKSSYDKGIAGKDALDTAQGQLDEAEADIAYAAAVLELADTNLKFTRVSAPFSGRLSRRMVDPGNLVKADDTLLTTLVALDPIYVGFDIDERTVLRLRDLIKKGEIKSSRETTRYVQIGLASDEDEFPLRGQIVFRDNQIDVGTGTLRIRALLSNPEIERQPRYMLSPGQFVRVRLPIGNPRQALLVPEKALGTNQGRKYLFVVTPENKVEQRDVEVGAQHGEYRVIENEKMKPEQRVKPGDQIVVEGLLRVRTGTEVAPTTAKGFRPAADPAPAAPGVEIAPPPRVKVVD